MRQFTGRALAALACLVLAAPAARAQEPGYRAPAQKPMPMLILPKPDRQVAPEQPAQEQAKPAAPAAPAAPEPVPQGKFPNKDTAKNRQDYEMGNDAPGSTLGRDAESGDTVIGHAPPKKKPQAARQPDMPITVKPVIKGGSW